MSLHGMKCNSYTYPLKQSRCSASIERVLVTWCTSEARKFQKCNYNDGHNDFLLNYNNGCKKHNGDLALKPSRFSQSVLH